MPSASQFATHVPVLARAHAEILHLGEHGCFVLSAPGAAKYHPAYSRSFPIMASTTGIAMYAHSNTRRVARTD